MSKRILHLIPRFTTGGAERLVLSYAKELPKAGFEVAVASVVGGGELVEEFRALGIPVLIGNWKNLRRFVREWQPDIIHTHVFSGDVIGYLLKRFLSRRSVWISTQHNTEEIYGRCRRSIMRLILRRADRVIAVSPAVVETCRQWFMVPAEKLVLIPNAIDLLPWLSIPDTIFSTAKIRLATIGRLEWQKGHDILLQALAEVGEIDWELHVYGDGSRRGELEKLAHQLGITSRVTWHGAVADMPRALAGVDIVVQPSRWEGMSLAVMEALAAARVVIASVAAGADLITNKETGMIVADENVSALTEAFRFILEHRTEARATALRARGFARDNFSLEKHINNVVQVYEESTG